MMGESCHFRHHFLPEEAEKQAAEEDTKDLCWHFKSRGICPAGETCKFRHHLLPGEVQNEKTEAEPPSNIKTVPCKHYMNGMCWKGDDCNFLHGDPTDIPKKRGADGVQQTGICKWFLQGECWAGDKCSNRHEKPDENQEAPPVRLQTYKTVPCKHFMTGNCFKGDACTFIHETSALKPLLISSASNYRTVERTALLAAPHRGSISINRAPVRSAEFSPNFRTVPCKHWVMKGECWKGANCTFLHEAGAQRKTEKSICWHFKRGGTCNMGDYCAFQHIQPEEKGEEEVDPNTLILFEQEGKQDVCQHFARGFCSKGEKCPFLHVMPADVCRHYSRGECRLGDRCKFQHPPTLRKKRPGLSLDAPPPAKRRKLSPNSVLNPKPPPPKPPSGDIQDSDPLTIDLT